jgi:hypothetical protein
VEALRVFAKRDPARFRKLLLEALATSATGIGRHFVISGDEIKTADKSDPARKEYQRHADLGADAIHLAGLLPEAAQVLEELERRIPGFRRVVALIEPLAAAQQALEKYLAASSEKTNDLVIQALQRIDLWRFPALVAALGGGKEGTGSYYAQQELLDFFRYLVTVLLKVKEIDFWLTLYRFEAGPIADKLEEVEILLEARSRYLGLIFDANPSYPLRRAYPRAPRPISELLKDADAYYADWRGLAADKKLVQVKASLKDLKTNLDTFNRNDLGIEGPGPGGFPNLSDPPDEVSTLQFRVEDLSRDVAGAAKSARDDAYLRFANRAEHQVYEYLVKWQLLTYWRTAFLLAREARDAGVGDFDDHHRWWGTADVVIGAVKQQLKSPNYAALQGLLLGWKFVLDALCNEINATAEAEAKAERRRKFWKRLAIAVVAIVITHGVVGVFAAEGLTLGGVATTLVGAATVTTVTTIGQVLVLHEQVGIRDIAIEFGKNAAFGFLFKFLNPRFVKIGRDLAPGRDLAQVVIVLGVDAAAGMAINLGVTLIEEKRLPDDMEEFFLSSIVIAATGALLGGQRLREQLRNLNALDAQIRNDLLARLDHLRQEGGDIFKEMQRIGARGPNEVEFKTLQQRLQRVLPELQEVLTRMSGAKFTDAQLSALGLDRGRLQLLPRIIARYAEIVRNSTWSSRSGTPSGGALPMPTTVVRDLVVLSPDAYEYNPSASGRSAAEVTDLLRGKGYQVVDTGGGVLQLSGAGLDRPLLLMPGRPSVLPPSLESVVGGYGVPAQRRAVQTLLTQPDTELVTELTSVAKTSKVTAQQLLRAIGRFLGPQHTSELKGIRSYLGRRSNAATLAKLLSPGDTGEWFIDVQKALRALEHFSPKADAGLKIFFELRAGLSASDALRIFHNFEAKQAAGIFESFEHLAPRSSNLRALLPDLTGNVPQKQKAVIGVLLAANRDVIAYPDGLFVFEDPTLAPGGELRVSDYRVFRKGGGLTLRVEVKEIYRLRSLADDAVRELATNIVIEVEERRALNARTRAFESIDWRIRRQEIAAETARRLKIADVNATAVQRQMVEDVKGRLRPAFDHDVIKRALKSGAITEAELAEYRKRFEDALPFVTFQ